MSNWLNKITKKSEIEKKAELDYNLSINGLEKLLKDIQLGITDVGANQQYLIEGPEISDLKIVRKSDPQKVANSISSFEKIFNFFEEVRTEPEDPTEEEIEQETASYTEMYASDWDFSNYDRSVLIDFFINYVDDTSQDEILEENISLPTTAVLKNYAQENPEYGEQIEEIFDFISKGLYSEESRMQIRETLKELSNKIFEDIYQIYKGYSREIRNWPPWIDDDGFKSSIDNLQDYDAFDSFIRNYYGNDLESSAYDSVYEYKYDQLKEIFRELEHNYDLDMDTISTPFYEDDPKFDLSLVSVTDILDTLSENYLIDNEDYNAACMYISDIVLQLASNENLKFIFMDDINSINMSAILKNASMAVAVSERAIEEGKIYNEIPPSLVQGAESRQLIESLTEQYKKMMMVSTERMQDLEKLKEIGIKRPFEHTYYMREKKYPGMGIMQNYMRRMKPFEIAISPIISEKGEIGESGIPEQLLKDLHLHSTRTGTGGSPLGWVGGFFDPIKGNMYITEVQSDVMQRTPYMRDPEKLQKQRQMEIDRLQNEIKKIENSIINAVSPRQLQTNKMNRMQKELQGLDPYSQQYQKVNQEILNIQSRIPQLPEKPNTIGLESKKNILLEQLAEQQNLLKNIPQGDRTPFGKSPAKYHDYKSKVENMFKSWVPIFFNTAIREAAQKEMNKVYIITSDRLMKLWASYARPETRSLFERVYDNTAKGYGAKTVEHRGQRWFEINLQNGVKWAKMNNWLTKISNSWIMQHPDGKLVWQIHLDKFFEIMKRKMPELAENDYDTEYSRNEGNNFIFQEWLQEVPPEMKMGEDLEPGFKQAVRQYLLENYNFDPYEFEEDEEEPDIVPSPDELERWWN